MPSQSEIAAQYQREQAAVSATVTRDTLALWLAGFVPEDDGAWGRLLNLLRALTRIRHNSSAALAASYYVRARATAGAAGSFAPTLAAQPPDELVNATAGITGRSAYRQSLRAGRTDIQARRNAGVQLAGAMERLAANGGRDTIREAVAEDPEAIGWIRVTGVKPCSFCSMLSGRGPVYTSRKTATFEAHSHCRCVAAAVWSEDEAWLGHSKDLAEQWQQATAGFTGAAARRAWRRHWEGRETATVGEAG